MKALNGQNGDANQQSSPTSNVETYWVVDVFGQNDKVKVRLLFIYLIRKPSAGHDNHLEVPFIAL